MVIIGKKTSKRIEELEENIKSLSQAVSAIKFNISNNYEELKKENKELTAKVADLEQTLQNYIDDGAKLKTGAQLVKEYLFGEEEDS